MTLPWSAADFFQRALTRHNQGDLVGALADFDEAARRDPHSAELRNNCGVLRRALGDIDGALAAFGEAIRCNPNFAEAFNNRGVIYLSRGIISQAMVDFDEAIRLVPSYTDALNNRGIARRSLGDLAGARADFDRVLQDRPNDVHCVRNRASVRREMRDLDGALADLERALTVASRPAAAAVYFDRGIIRMLQADWAVAVADFDKALEINPRYTAAYIYRGNARFHNHDSMAINDHLRGFRIDGPRAASEVVEVIGGDLMRDQQGFFDDCENHLGKNPDDFVALIRRGVGLLLRNRNVEAMADLERVAGLGHEHRSQVQLLRRAVEDYQGRRKTARSRVLQGS
jgi:tetratricopeptide (TPR) repeat protein